MTQDEIQQFIDECFPGRSEAEIASWFRSIMERARSQEAEPIYLELPKDPNEH